MRVPTPVRDGGLILADMRRATELTDENPYHEITRYLKVHRDQVETVFRTLSFVDVALLGRRATAPGLFSVGLMDVVCPPSTVYAAYNAAAEDAKNLGSLEVPLHLRNAPTRLMKEIGYGKGYRYAHDEPGGFAAGERYFGKSGEALELQAHFGVGAHRH